MRRFSAAVTATVFLGGCSAAGAFDAGAPLDASAGLDPSSFDASSGSTTDASLPSSAIDGGSPGDSFDARVPDANGGPVDAGEKTRDAAARDGGSEPLDSGPLPAHDSGSPPSPAHDSGSPKTDAAPAAFDSGLPPVTGTIGANGGSASRLYFAVIGDTRPPAIDDTSGYPTRIITDIYADIASLTPQPLFAVGTGDYSYATPNHSGAAAQLDLYLGARSQYSGAFFPALGNHDCANAVPSNCGPGNADGLTTTYSTYLDKLLGPIGRTVPYYSFDVTASDGSWTAKFVVVAANAWDDGQSAWLEATLAKPTTYTFIMRHEPKVPSGTPAADTSIGGPLSDAIIETFPYTMKITGHVHLHAKSGPKEVIVGNGGAPLNGGSYGFGLVEQLADGNIQFDVLDYETLAPDLGFRFYVRPDGTEVKTP